MILFRGKAESERPLCVAMPDRRLRPTAAPDRRCAPEVCPGQLGQACTVLLLASARGAHPSVRTLGVNQAPSTAASRRPLPGRETGSAASLV